MEQKYYRSKIIGNHFFFARHQTNIQNTIFIFLPLIRDFFNSCCQKVKWSEEVFQKTDWSPKASENPDPAGLRSCSWHCRVVKQLQHNTVDSLSHYINIQPKVIISFRKWSPGKVQSNWFSRGQINSLLEGKIDKLMWILDYWQWKGYSCISVSWCSVWQFTWNLRQVHCQPWRLTQMRWSGHSRGE